MDFWLKLWVSERTPGVPPIVEALSDVGLDPTGGYIYQRHIIAAQFITTRPIFNLQWQRRGGRDPQRPLYHGNRREHGSEISGGGQKSNRCSGNNTIVLITIQ